MLTEQELAYQIATGCEDVFIDEDILCVDAPQVEIRAMMIHNALINRLNTGVLQVEGIDWASFIDSIFEMNYGLDFINRVQNVELKARILQYWIDNYDKIVDLERIKNMWVSEREKLE